MATTLVNQTSGADFIKFWDYVIEKGLMNEFTARSYGSASRKILSVEDNWEEIDITTIELDKFISRFQNLHSRDYSPKTMKVYARRFTRALRQYLEFLDNPSGWKPPLAKRTSTSKVTSKEEASPSTSKQSGFISRTTMSDPNLKMITHQFPLRENCVIQIRLPIDMTELDIERLTNFLEILVIPSNSSIEEILE